MELDQVGFDTKTATVSGYFNELELTDSFKGNQIRYK